MIKNLLLILFYFLSSFLVAFDLSPFQRTSHDHSGYQYTAILFDENAWASQGVDLNDKELKDLKEVVGTHFTFMVLRMKVSEDLNYIITRPEKMFLNTSCKFNGIGLLQSDLTQYPDVAYMFNSVVDSFGESMGDVGKGLKIIHFKKPREANLKGSLVLSYLKNHQLTWKYPLVEFLPPMLDPDTKEAFQGDYKFNPYNGNRLIPSK